MRRGLVVFLALVFLGLLTAIAAFSWTRQNSTPMGWMRTRFSLDDRQAETIARIHAEYENDCAQMCAKIAESDERLAALLRSSQTITPEIEETIIQTDRLRSECRSKMLAHFYRIAAELPAEKRGEYLEVVFPSVLRPGEMAQSHWR